MTQSQTYAYFYELLFKLCLNTLLFNISATKEMQGSIKESNIMQSNNSDCLVLYQVFI